MLAKYAHQFCNSGDAEEHWFYDALADLLLCRYLLNMASWHNMFFGSVLRNVWLLRSLLPHWGFLNVGKPCMSWICCWFFQSVVLRTSEDNFVKGKPFSFRGGTYSWKINIICQRFVFIIILLSLRKNSNGENKKDLCWVENPVKCVSVASFFRLIH